MLYTILCKFKKLCSIVRSMVAVVNLVTRKNLDAFDLSYIAVPIHIQKLDLLNMIKHSLDYVIVSLCECAKHSNKINIIVTEALSS